MPTEYNGIPLFAPAFAMQNTSYNPEKFAELYDIEAAHFWFNYRNKLIIQSLKKHCQGFESFLEIGCGTGFVLSGIMQAFSDVRLHGSEIYVAGLSFTSKRVNDAVNLYQLNAEEIPFRNEFDVIGAFDVLEHIEEDVDVLRQVHGALTARGKVLLTVPQHRFLWSQTDVEACHVRRYTQKELASKLQEAGFKVIFKTSFMTFLMPLMFLSRRGKRKPSTKESEIELNINPLVNHLCKMICTLENLAINYKIHFPFGGSLLMIAEKN